ncbi:MAG: glycosyltransferase [Luteibaculaceae bacterium]
MQNKWLIVPCYNEQLRLPIQAFTIFLTQNFSYNICFINDGSTDMTAEKLSAIKKDFPETVDVVDLQINVGKAEAIRQGFNYLIEQYKPSFIGFADADLATELEEIALLFNKIEAYQHINIIMGSRFKRLGSHIKRSEKRHFLGRFFSTLASLMLKMPIYDTQCGAKVFRIGSTDFLFKEPFKTSWLFDVEFIARYRNKMGKGKAIKSMFEYPLEKWTEVPGSKIKFKHYLKVPLQLVTVWYTYNIMVKQNK